MLVARLSAEMGGTAVFDDFNHRHTPVESLPAEWIIVVQHLSSLPRPYRDLATSIVEHTGEYSFAPRAPRGPAAAAATAMEVDG